MNENEEEFSLKNYFLPFTSTKAVVFIILIGLLVYFVSLFNGFVADDNIYILGNPLITNFNLQTFLYGSSYYTGDVTKLAGIYYKPLFTLAVSLLFQLSHGTPFLFHLTQLLLHIVNSSLLFLFFSKFFRKKISFFLGLIFLLHPANVESVVYIANLQEPLFFFFGIIALFIISRLKTINWKSFLLISLFLLLSLLSKETGILFLLATVSYSIFFNKKKMMSFLLAGSVFWFYIFLRFIVAHVAINKQVISPIMGASIGIRLLTLPKIIYSYLLLFFFPKNLSWGQHWLVKSIDFPNFYFPIIIIILTAVVLLLLYLQIKNRKTLTPTFFFFLSVSIMGLSLHSQLIPLDFTFADRWIYFPMMGFLGLFGIFLQNVLNKKISPILLISLSIILLAVLTVRSFIRTLDWKDDYTLSIHDVKVDPDSFALQNNLGVVLVGRGNYLEAKKHLEKSLELYPIQGTYDSLAFVYSKLGNPEKSLQFYEKSLGMGDFYMTYQNYIAELIRQKKLNEALNETKLALKKYPYNPKLWLLLAVVEYEQGNTDEAIISAQNANVLSPGIGDFVLSKIENKLPIPL